SRWRFPARPGTGRRGLGGAPRQRVPALLRVGPGFDAALQVSAAIGTNLRRFRAVFGESGGGGGSGEDEQFLGFGS
uniref:Histone-lysine N-methyltransferase 2A n=1 Tax=Homo sapiens TaxID=9606 RepID=UPI00024ED2A7|nr:Chain M, Histone-lysine N-methyltransferase 2A [Homo sapiens]3U88_N Chain N, Histone-lysine N-methyltransferase 2A [Homo sapiens]